MIDAPAVDIPPLAGASGRVALPGSKSISNRVLLLAALSTGETLVRDLLDSDDTRVMLDALRRLGCGVTAQGPGGVAITGLGHDAKTRLTLPNGDTSVVDLFLGNAGTAMRPLTAALALMGGRFHLSGVNRMHERPIGDLVEALQAIGCDIEYLGQAGYPPLRIGHPRLQIEGPIRVRGDVSSQFLTALLMALPLVSADREVQIDVVGELISKPYIEITLRMLERFGITVARSGWSRFTIPRGSSYRSPGVIHVEADASSASYFIALGAIATTATGSKEPGYLKIDGVGAESIQGDIRFVDAARAMGAEVVAHANSLEVRRGAWPLRAIDMDCNAIPDAAMTLAVMALYADGPSTLRNIASWRVKETDRIAAMATELRKLGATVDEGADHIRVYPLAADQWRAATIHTYDDHRVAMCFSLAAFNPARLPVRILDPRCVGKTFPDYFECLFDVSWTEADHIPVLCIDGPSASGKGTLASAIAQRLGYHFLDSGAMYRLTALVADRAGIAIQAPHETIIADLARRMPVRFEQGRVWLDGDDVTEELRSEQMSMNASCVSTFAAVRSALVELQRSFRRLPGLVADGRDMGTVIFPDARLKIYLTASAAVRAERRHKQLISKGISANIDSLRADLEARDARDTTRAVAPLKPAQDALLLDNSSQSIDQSIEQVLKWWEARRPFLLGA